LVFLAVFEEEDVHEFGVGDMSVGLEPAANGGADCGGADGETVQLNNFRSLDRLKYS